MIHKHKYLLLSLGLVVILTTGYLPVLAVPPAGKARPPTPPPNLPQVATNIIDDGAAECGGLGSKCQWAWNDVIGWIDFRFDALPNVNVSDSELTGYASSSVGYIALNCNASNPTGVILCGTSNFKVLNNVSGELSGWAWNDQIGWISFRCQDCATSNYGVNIVISESGTHCSNIGPLPPTTCGDFTGWAWNDVIGWISFNCANSGTNGCSTPGIQYKVKTSWEPPPPTLPDGSLVSSIFDTCPSPSTNCGAAINSIMWRGSLSGVTKVRFQIASSNCPGGQTDPACTAGSWNFGTSGVCPAIDSCFLGPGGSSNTSTDFYEPLFNFVSGTAGYSNPASINAVHHNNKRYVRYRVLLKADGALTPQVDDIIINWSP